MSKKLKSFNDWSTSGKCPICHLPFKSSSCKHNVNQVRERFEENRVRFIVQDELKKLLKKENKNV